MLNHLGLHGIIPLLILPLAKILYDKYRDKKLLDHKSLKLALDSIGNNSRYNVMKEHAIFQLLYNKSFEQQEIDFFLKNQFSPYEIKEYAKHRKFLTITDEVIVFKKSVQSIRNRLINNFLLPLLVILMAVTLLFVGQYLLSQNVHQLLSTNYSNLLIYVRIAVSLTWIISGLFVLYLFMFIMLQCNYLSYWETIRYWKKIPESKKTGHIPTNMFFIGLKKIVKILIKIKNNVI